MTCIWRSRRRKWTWKRFVAGITPRSGGRGAPSPELGRHRFVERYDGVALAPGSVPVIEPPLDARLDDLEERRDIEVARHVQTMVADAPQFAHQVRASRIAIV